MAARTAQAVDATTLLHTGPVAVACAGFTDPAGNPWIVMNDAAAAVNGLQVANASTGGTVVLSVGGANVDANPNMQIRAGSSSTTGTLTIGSSGGAVTLAGTVTSSQGLAFSSNLTVTGTVSASNITSCAIVTAQTTGAASNPLVCFQLGSSGPRIFFGASTPTSSARPGDLFLSTSGSSAALFAVGMANGNTASSSNWATYGPL